MKFKMRYKFHDGMTFDSNELDSYEIQGDGDIFKLILRGKMDGREIRMNTNDGQQVVRNYMDVSSVEILFIES